MVWRRALARVLDSGFVVLALLAGVPEQPVLALYWLYETVLTARSGQTLGKRLAGVRVVRSGDRPPRLTRSAVRALPILLLAMPYAWLLTPLAYLWALPAADHRGLHDRAAGTRVIGGHWLVGDPTDR